MRRLLLFFSILLFLLILPFVYARYECPSYAQICVLATGYGVKISKISGGYSHISLDNLSAETTAVVPIRCSYKLNYSINSKGLVMILVRKKPDVEVGFSISYAHSTVYFADSLEPALKVESEFEQGVAAEAYRNVSVASNFKVYSSSNGEYGYTEPQWLHSPPLNKPGIISYSTFTRRVINTKDHIGMKINLSAYIENTSYPYEKSHSVMNTSVLLDKKNCYVNLTIRGYVHVSNVLNSQTKEATIKIIVNDTGTYAYRNGVLKYHSSSTNVRVKDIPNIWEGSPGVVVAGYVDGFATSNGNVEVGNITIKYSRNAGKILEIKSGEWIFNSSEGTLTMQLYPRPTAGKYEIVELEFIRY